MFVKYLCSILCVILLQAKFSQQNGIADYFDVCSRNDPEINSCIENAINTGVRRIASGIPEVKLPPLDPMEFDNVDMREGYGNFKFMMTLSNFTVEGFSNMKVKNVRIDFHNENNITIKLDIHLPYAVLRGNYLADGRVLIIPLKGDGEIFLNATTLVVETTIKCRTVLNQKDQEQHLYAKSFGVHVSVKGGKSHFSNLFNGNKQLATAVNKFFSEHIPEIFDSIRHLPEKAFSAKFKDYCNILFKSYPFDELILPN